MRSFGGLGLRSKMVSFCGLRISSLPLTTSVLKTIKTELLSGKIIQTNPGKSPGTTNFKYTRTAFNLISDAQEMAWARWSEPQHTQPEQATRAREGRPHPRDLPCFGCHRQFQRARFSAAALTSLHFFPPSWETNWGKAQNGRGARGPNIFGGTGSLG